MAAALVLAAILAAGVVWFLVITEASASTIEWTLAVASGAVSTIGLYVRRSRPNAGAAIVIAANACSLVGVPALMSVLFMTGLHARPRHQVVITLAATAVGVAQFAIWVVVLGPDRSAGGYAAIALAHVASFLGAVATGLAAGRLRARRDEADHALVVAREREAAVVAEVREQERMRIAHSLHDSIGRHLAVVHIYGSVLQHRDVLSDGEISSTSAELLRATDGIADDLQKILTMLHPGSDGHLERDRDLPGLLDRFEHAAGAAGMGVEQRIDLAALERAPAEVSASIVDFLSECTTNVLKYGSEGKVSIVVSMRTPTMVQAEVANDRSRISKRSIISTGMGLMALRERAALLGGELSILSEPTRFRVALALPVDR
ncbi:hypothetical protein GCM10009846_00060 [Agrococcus versicolor]|uniref:Signal transduction histidine kinase subgroup 3 dimerisation and phosphoacceptor domain-containing protein n=1 Tax=Agrococcus versicolor TaxID=501482 RepID=A0ABN3AI91_9MICO